MFYLVAYDIANDKRLRRVARVMQSYGARVQRSVFECRIDAAKLAEMIARIRGVIKTREDKINIYRLCETCQQRFATCGRGRLVEDEETWVC